MSLAERVLHYLGRAEFRETDPWLRDDIRIAWLTVLFASRGDTEPFARAHCQLLGVHPDQLQTAMEARRRAQLGPFYVSRDQWGDIPDQPIPSSPKKPVQSERDPNYKLRRKA